MLLVRDGSVKVELSAVNEWWCSGWVLAPGRAAKEYVVMVHVENVLDVVMENRRVMTGIMQ